MSKVDEAVAGAVRLGLQVGFFVGLILGLLLSSWVVFGISWVAGY